MKQATGTFEAVIGEFRQVLSSLPDNRRGKNSRYSMADAGLSAFSVFFTQTASFLGYQRAMATSKGRSNAGSLFGVHQIPSDNQIRSLLDGVSPECVYPMFTAILTRLHGRGYLDAFRSVSNTLLIALDGTEYFSSTQIHCPKCSTRVLKTAKGEVTQYFHSVLTPVVVCPGRSEVFPLEPEFVVPQDGHDKQDCENAAAKRWLRTYGERYSPWRVTLLGDDLYCCQPLVKVLVDQHLNFILVCRPTSHKTLYEHLEGIELPTVEHQQWRGKRYETWCYRYLNQVPLIDDDEALLVNWCELTITRADGHITYKNAFATHFHITDETVVEIVEAGRTRWKVENENNNTLKTKGYNLEHNFGHGQQHLAAVLATLNILSLLFHTLLGVLDTQYQRLREQLGTRKTFFNDLQALTRYMYFQSWDHLLAFMIDGLELDTKPDTS